MRQSVIVVDDFYDDVDEIRNLAMRVTYPEGQEKAYYSGKNSREALINEGIVNAMSTIVAHPLVPELHSPNGNFRIGLKGDQPRHDIHVDPFRDWAGIVYLTLPEHCEGGTAFWRHKTLGVEFMPRDPAEYARYGYRDYEDMRVGLAETDGLDRSKWEMTMMVPMRYNRLILFRPWMWHSHTHNFGDAIENGRLIQLFFFNHRTAAADSRLPYEIPPDPLAAQKSGQPRPVGPLANPVPR